MIPSEFDYVKAGSVQEALGLLQQHGDDAKVLAGGHSLVPMLKLRLANPAVLVDISGISELKGITSGGDKVTIGALTTHNDIEHSAELKNSFPILAEAATLIGDPMVRNRGTFGGSLAHADPAGDWPAVALALGAQMHITGPGGERTVAADDFFIDILTSDVQPGELLTAIDLPVSSGKVGMSYQKFSHPASGYAVVGVAATVTVDGSGNCASARVAVTGAGAKATRLTSVEDALVGKPLTEENVAAAAGTAGDGIDYLGDIYASEEYRAHLVKVFAKRAVLAAAGNIK
ncbi:MAG TPA: xanthine dehydrogenase family protein subunit M [Thermomicrobiales bacterium]|jgi:carbon-monoxide dehydrogenase medium subunit